MSRYRYLDAQGNPALRCPNCAAQWTAPDSLWLQTSVAGRTIVEPTRLDDAGCLVDVDRLVANGYHLETVCRGCDEPLIELQGNREGQAPPAMSSDKELAKRAEEVSEKQFREHLEWVRKEAATWPEWKRNLPGPHYSDRKAAEQKTKRSERLD